MGWIFAHELARYGPDSPPLTTVGLSAARAYCSYVTRSHYENFTVASALLPRRLRPHFHAVYAFCRWSDDLADESGANAQAMLAWWRGELLAMYASQTQHPVLIALADTARRFDIPPKPFLDLLHAFEQDQLVARYDNFDQLIDYCRHSANPVGRLVLHLFDCHTPDRLAASDSICTGLQLANFWQDVARDLVLGRVYLPDEDRRRFGYPDTDLEAKRFTPAFAELLRFQVNRTWAYFERGESLLSTLPLCARRDVSLFLGGGRAVLAAIERQGYDVWSRRPIVSSWTKAVLFAKAVGGSLWPA